MIKSLLKKSVFLIITFVGIAFICNIITTMNMSIISNKKENNEYLTEKSVKLCMENVQSLSTDNLRDFANKHGEFLLYKDDSYNVYRGVYCTKKFIPSVPMLEGRYFTEVEFNSTERTAVVGKSKLKDCYYKNGIRYYMNDGNEYKVIGIMGYEYKATNLDWKVHYNMGGVYSDENKEGRYTFESGKNSHNMVYKFLEYMNKNVPGSVINIEGGDNNVLPNMETLMESVVGSMLTVIVLIICIALNTVSLTSDWIENRIKELAIKKAFGATNSLLSKSIKIEYIMVVTISYLLGFIISTICIKVGMLGKSGREIYLFSTLISYIICLAVGFITVKIPVKKALKIQVAEIMR